MRRRGRPGLLGVAARTAVVAGTATAVSGSVRNKQEVGFTEGLGRSKPRGIRGRQGQAPRFLSES